MESNSALASLTATYTDSEGEDHHMEQDTDASNGSQVIIPPQPTAQKPETVQASGNDEDTTTSTEPKKARKKPKNPKKNVRRLVSYNDDTIVSEDEDMEETESEESEEEEHSDDQDAAQPTNEATEDTVSRSMDPDDASKTVDKVDLEKTDRWAKYGFSLPPEPEGKCSQKLQDKIALLYEKMKHSKLDMNRNIQERKDFRNPSIYEKLISFCDINEFGTNYPPEIYDPLQWGPESFYEELAKAQKLEVDRREKERKDNSKVELALAAAKKVEEEAKRRKSKWDQPGPSSNTASTASGTTSTGGGSGNGSGVPLTTNITGTKGTVISAFGSLPKKPKA